MPVLGDVCQGRNNNLNLVRILLATAVLVSHSYPIGLGTGAEEPLQRIVGSSLGSLAVFGFFSISGFLVTRSLVEGRNLAGYLRARALRIFPGLLVVLVLTIFALGSATTVMPLGQYFSDYHSWHYLFANLTLVHLQYDLPGVFGGNPFPKAINGSLWTLPYEVACYLALAGFWIAGAFASSRNTLVFGTMLVFLFVVSAIWSPFFSAHASLAQLRNLFFFFCSGSAAYLARRYVPLDRRLALAGLVIAVGSALAQWNYPLYPAFFYAIFTFGYLPAGSIGLYNKIGDYSYGVYIYAFPIQQLIVWSRPGITPLWLTMASFPIVLLCAAISWHVVEKPALTLKVRSVTRHWTGKFFRAAR